MMGMTTAGLVKRARHGDKSIPSKYFQNQIAGRFGLGWLKGHEHRSSVDFDAYPRDLTDRIVAEDESLNDERFTVVRFLEHDGYHDFDDHVVYACAYDDLSLSWFEALTLGVTKNKYLGLKAPVFGLKSKRSFKVIPCGHKGVDFSIIGVSAEHRDGSVVTASQAVSSGGEARDVLSKWGDEEFRWFDDNRASWIIIRDTIAPVSIVEELKDSLGDLSNFVDPVRRDADGAVIYGVNGR